MKTFQEFILEAEFIRTVNQNQVFRVKGDKETQKNLNNARPMGPGSPKVGPKTFKIVPVGPLK
jgi:hypothetical protein